MQFEQLSSLLSPEKLPYLSGVERLPGGILHVAVLTRMPGVTPRMVEWWFGQYLETTEQYKRWHARDHVWMSWEDKQPDTHVGAKNQPNGLFDRTVMELARPLRIHLKEAGG